MFSLSFLMIYVSRKNRAESCIVCGAGRAPGRGRYGSCAASPRRSRSTAAFSSTRFLVSG